MSEITLSCSVLKTTRNSALEEMLLTQQKLPSSEIKSLEMNGYFKATSITLFISFFALYGWEAVPCGAFFMGNTGLKLI